MSILKEHCPVRGLLLPALMLALAPLLSAMEFEHAYTPEKLPNESNPEWRLSGKAGEAKVTLSNGKLKVSTVSDKKFHYTLGVLETGAPAGSGAAGWDASGGTTTIDFRLRCDGDDPDAECFVLLLADGARRWHVRFFPNKIHVARGGAREVDTSQGDTYRVTLDDDKLQLSSATHGTLFKDVKGIGGGTRNRILFGNFPEGKKAPATPVAWELEFLRWTHTTANAELPKEN